MITVQDVRAVALSCPAFSASASTGSMRGWPLTLDEMRELVTDAWRMCVPEKVAAAHPGRDVERAAREER
ncbi:MAG TPA: hypothetical protein VE733_15970 [Streptosporangiaceae bacterium]|nr:hypothetical protein [Streptosporangiaceae bacterium]